jgi:hypothetical protein
MIIKAGVTFIWSGTNASIPSGWSRVTALDGIFAKGTAVGVDPNVSGGAATHTHTSPTHTHTNAAHTHTITVAAGVTALANCGSGADGPVYNHTHADFTSGALASFSASSPTATYGSVSNNPPYYEVIFCTPTSDITDGSFPTGMIGLADANAPTGFYVCDGNNSTPNLVDKYLKGAAGGGNAGGTGGSTTNIHALSHTHTTSHVHSAATSPAQSSLNANGNAGSGNVTLAHTHSISLPAATPSTTDNVSLTTTETVEPTYTKLMAIQNSSASTIPIGIIGMWTGALASIPAGFILCDGSGGTVDMRGRHLKITATSGDIAATGGSNTHTHASQNHGHSVAHTHSSSIDHNGITAQVIGSGSTTATRQTTTHAISTNSIDLVLADSATTADSSSNEPQFLTVAFIKRVEVSSISFSISSSISASPSPSSSVSSSPSTSTSTSVSSSPSISISSSVSSSPSSSISISISTSVSSSPSISISSSPSISISTSPSDSPSSSISASPSSSVSSSISASPSISSSISVSISSSVSASPSPTFAVHYRSIKRPTGSYTNIRRPVDSVYRNVGRPTANYRSIKRPI